MIHHDIEKAKTLTPRLKLYFRMAKMEIQKVNPSDAHKLKEKCKDLTPAQRQKAVQMMKSNKVKWVDNDFVLLIR